MTSPPRRRFALATLCAVLFLTFLDTTIVSVALANIQSGLHADVAQLQWVVNGYALPFASLMLAFGSLGDRIGRKRVLLGGLVVFVAGSLVSSFAPNPATLIAGRALMGAGAAASEPGTLSMIRHLFVDDEARGHALGAWAAVGGLALALGPVIGGALVGFGNFRAIFWFSAGAGVLALAAAAKELPEVRGDRPAGPFDVVGLVAVTTALAAATFAIIDGESAGFSSPVVVALFAVAVVAGAGFLVAERRAANPLIDLAFLRSAPFTGSLLVAFALFFGIFSIFFFTALYLQVVVGLSAYRTTGEFAAMAVAMVAGSAAGGLLVPYGPRLPMTLGCLLAGAGMFATDAVLQAAASPNEILLAGALALGGLGFGLGVVPVTSVALEEVPPEHSGMAASATNTSRELGAVMGVAVLGALVNAHLTADLATRLHQLGIPNALQAIVVHAIETGGVPSNASGAVATYGQIVNRVIHAAFGAFRDGLHVSLMVAGAAILAGGLVALVSLSRHARAGGARPDVRG